MGLRERRVEDVINQGDALQVEVTDIDPMGKISLVPVELPPRVAELPADYHEVIVLRHLEGLTFPQVAERMGRRAFLAEIDPAYCDVIVERWEQFTGRKAEGWKGND